MLYLFHIILIKRNFLIRKYLKQKYILLFVHPITFHNHKTSINLCKLVFLFSVNIWHMITKTFKNMWRWLIFSIEHCNLPEKIKMRTSLSFQIAQLFIFLILAITGKNNRTEIILLIFATVTVFFAIVYKLKHLKLTNIFNKW